jgi:hypothetical protein
MIAEPPTRPNSSHRADLMVDLQHGGVFRREGGFVHGLSPVLIAIPG